MNRATVLRSACAAAMAGAVYSLLLRPRHLHWGATEAECREPLPGDEIAPDAKGVATHAITIHAPIAEVWPWLAQIGQDRGGFYSYAWLENLVGCHLHNADRIVGEWQGIAVGDRVWLHPKAPPLPVLLVEPERMLVLGSNTDIPGAWGFHLKPLDANTTRLIIRSRGEGQPGALGWIGHHLVFEPAHFIMERKMLLGIKQRAEACCAGL